MRQIAILLLGGLAACTSGDITVPTDPVFRQVQTTSASSSGSGDFASTIETALADPSEPGAAPLPQAGTPLDDDHLNLTLYTIEQQKIDARIAERELAEARSRLVVVQPTSGSVPQGSSVNVTLYAQQSTNQVGQRIYQRRAGVGGGCGRYASADAAQRAFLEAGGPTSDPRGLDPDGDGFACDFDPAPYRALKL